MIFREKFKTLKHVFDLFTERQLWQLISSGVLKGLESPISMGKEGNIFTAITPADERVIVKIYRLSTCDFFKMYEFLISDPRFKDLKHRRRHVIFTWAQREYRNLLKVREAGLRVPTAMAIKSNVLVMSYIGTAETPAPKLIHQPPKNPAAFFKEIIDQLKKLYKAGMVHGDLSAHNILNLEEKPVLIDWSQATTLDNPNANIWLERDVKNICVWFAKRDVKTDPKKVLKEIVGK